MALERLLVGIARLCDCSMLRVPCAVSEGDSFGGRGGIEGEKERFRKLDKQEFSVGLPTRLNLLTGTQFRDKRDGSQRRTRVMRALRPTVDDDGSRVMVTPAGQLSRWNKRASGR